MLPRPIYESLPYAYIVGGVTSIAVTAFDPLVALFSAVLVAVGVLVLILRHHNRQAAVGASSRRGRHI